jgi:hypothetical protein
MVVARLPSNGVTSSNVRTVRGSEHPRGMLLGTRSLASSEQTWDPMTSSSAICCRKTSTRTHRHQESGWFLEEKLRGFLKHLNRLA